MKARLKKEERGMKTWLKEEERPMRPQQLEQQRPMRQPRHPPTVEKEERIRTTCDHATPNVATFSEGRSMRHTVTNPISHQDNCSKPGRKSGPSHF